MDATLDGCDGGCDGGDGGNGGDAGDGGNGGDSGGDGGDGQYTYTSAKLRVLLVPGSRTVMKLPEAPAQLVTKGPFVEGAVCAAPPQSVPPVLPAESPTQIS